MKKSLLISALAFAAFAANIATASEAPIEIGSRLEPLIDNYLTDSMQGTTLVLHTPAPREVAIVYDKPWEGNVSAYVTVFADDGLFRMYYRGSNYDVATKKESEQRVCYAESRDGIIWTKPELGLFEFEGSKANNIVWQGVGVHNFAPFRDANPNCKPEAKYKALASGEEKARLIPFQSPDAIHWSLIQEQPVITEGAFDSQNLAFWDSARGRYVEFHRGFNEGVRDIMTSASDDFLRWPAPQYITYGDAPREHLYTNAIVAYPRAPHVFFGFPKRFMPERNAKVNDQPGVSDGVFMTSRDGLAWHRWQEALVRPGLQKSRWVNRNNMTAWGILQTKSSISDTPDELSIYSSEGYYVGPCAMRRYTVRLDGFVSVNAPGSGGEFVTKPLLFAGAEGQSEAALYINYSTSAAGSVRCAVLDEAGAPLSGYAIEDCDEIYGDDIARPVTWRGGANLNGLAEKPVRLRFAMKDADLYSLQVK